MATCHSCQNVVPDGARWCALCRVNLLTPATGRLSSPGKRFGAYVLDIMIPGVALFLILGAAGAGASASSGGGLLIALLLMGAYAVWALRLFAQGTTPGKRALGMKVVLESGEPAGFGTMLFREWIGKLLSGLIFSLGFIWILLDRERQGWHDKLASTFVVG